MTTVEFYLKEKNIIGFKVSGHTGFAKRGEDIVCSAVSALTQTALIGLEKVAGAKVEYSIKDGFLQCRIIDTRTELGAIKCSAILETLYEGLKNIEATYENYIRLSDKEEV
ncbi:MAG: ribosomal-processing cysteine protease Prp [Bacillota bacterium]